jgi:hypothetical protein
VLHCLKPLGVMPGTRIASAQVYEGSQDQNASFVQHQNGLSHRPAVRRPALRNSLGGVFKAHIWGNKVPTSCTPRCSHTLTSVMYLVAHGPHKHVADAWRTFLRRSFGRAVTSCWRVDCARRLRADVRLFFYAPHGCPVSPSCLRYTMVYGLW